MHLQGEETQGETLSLHIHVRILLRLLPSQGETATMTKMRRAGKCRAASALFAKLGMLARMDEFDEALFVTVQVRVVP